MMLPTQADVFIRDRLRALDVLLTHSGDGRYVGRSSDALLGWAAFQEMAQERPIQHFEEAGQTLIIDTDLLLFETYLVTESAHSLYHASFARQFSFVSAEQEYLGSSDVVLEIDFPYSSALQPLVATQIWGTAADPPAESQVDLPTPDWIVRVSSDRAFHVPLATSAPIRWWFAGSPI